MPRLTNAMNMAGSIGVDPDAFRQLLRDAKFPWHKRHDDDWEVKIASAEYSAMRTLLVTLLRPKKLAALPNPELFGAASPLIGLLPSKSVWGC